MKLNLFLKKKQIELRQSDKHNLYSIKPPIGLLSSRPSPSQNLHKSPITDKWASKAHEIASSEAHAFSPWKLIKNAAFSWRPPAHFWRRRRKLSWRRKGRGRASSSPWSRIAPKRSSPPHPSLQSPCSLNRTIVDQIVCSGDGAVLGDSVLNLFLIAFLGVVELRLDASLC